MNQKFSSPYFRNRFVLLADIVLVLVSVLGSFALRYDVGQMSFYFPAIMIMAGVALVVKDSHLLFLWSLSSFMGLCQCR